MKKVAINLYGGPGTGKSTAAADAYAIFKKAGVNAELVREYVKNWVWEGRKIRPNDQYYIFAKQARAESITFEGVDLIITDSPVWLSAIYEAKFEPKPHICGVLIDKHVQLATRYNIEYIHIFLRRVKPYEPRGRLQTEEEARVIDQEILDYLDEQGLVYTTITADNSAGQNIMDLVGKIRASG